MSEYSVEELREIAKRGDGFRPGHTRRDIATAYADLLERIKADESAVPVAQLRLRLDRWDVVGIHGAIEKLHLPAGEYPLFVRPPAQAAQVDAMPEIRAWLADYADELDEQGFTDVAATIRTTTASMGASPTAEPVAQGEVVARLDDSGRANFERWARCNWSLEVDRDTSGNYNDRETRAAWASWREALRLAAQPRAVPDVKDIGESPEDMFLDDDQDAAWVDGWNMCRKTMLAAAPSPGESA